MIIKLIPYKLFFKYPFRIAHTSREFTDNVYLVLQDGENIGIGEAVFPPYLKEDFFTFNALIQRYSNEIKELSFATYVPFLEKLFHDNVTDTAAIACIDMALNEFFFKKTHLISSEVETISSYTIGLCTRKEFEQKIEENISQSYFKLKIDQDNYRWILDLYKKKCTKPFVLDANQGFWDYKFGLSCARYAAELGALYLEQVYEKGNLIWHKKLKEENLLPIIADESFQTIYDLPKVQDSFDGVNIKLMKCGGILQAQQILNYCKENNLKTVLGCMSDSIIAIKQAEKLAPSVDWLDLDGHLLNKNNPTRNFLLNP